MHLRDPKPEPINASRRSGAGAVSGISEFRGSATLIVHESQCWLIANVDV